MRSNSYGLAIIFYWRRKYAYISGCDCVCDLYSDNWAQLFRLIRQLERRAVMKEVVKAKLLSVSFNDEEIMYVESNKDLLPEAKPFYKGTLSVKFNDPDKLIKQIQELQYNSEDNQQ
jgi:hypothetical protein